MPSRRTPCSSALAALFLAGAASAWETVREPLLVRSARGDSAVLPERFRVVVWNVHKRTDSVFLGELSRLVDSADIVVLQEFALPAPGALAAALGGRPWALSANLLAGSPPAVTGVLTSSSSLRRSLALLSDASEPFLGTRKPALASYHASGADTLLVLNLHALNFHASLDGFRRQVASLADLAGSHPGPVVAAGDFNTWSRARLRTADSILRHASLVRLDFGPGESSKRRAFGHALDHVYYGPRCLRPVATAMSVPTRFRSSDHVPLVATFERIR